jgi:Rieske Fe-S protein
MSGDDRRPTCTDDGTTGLRPRATGCLAAQGSLKWALSRERRRSMGSMDVDRSASLNRQRIFDVWDTGKARKGVVIMSEGEPESGTTRRAVLFGAAVVGATGFITACGSESSGGNGVPPPPYGPPETQGPIHTSDIPVGGGVVFAKIVAVVTQPSAGTFKAFDATCKHQGCLVGSIVNGFIVCPCHLSRYRIDDGSVVNGPATQPLDPKHISVTGNIITVS